MVSKKIYLSHAKGYSFIHQSRSISDTVNLLYTIQTFKSSSIIVENFG